MDMDRTYRVGILLFDEAEVLDFAGPFEAFSITKLADGRRPFSVYTIAEHDWLIKARNGLLVQPNYTFLDTPELDVFIIPGGYGAKKIEIHNEKLIRFIQETAARTPLTASVCTGAFLLAQAGLLNGKTATTHWLDTEELQHQFPDVHVVTGVRFVDQGSIMTSGGVSSGIHMSLHIVRKLLGEDVAKSAARRMEYDIVF